MRILFGDVFGRPGREAVKKILPTWREMYRPDFIIANIENIVHGAGVTREKTEELRNIGVDGFTLGDHALDVPKARELLSDAGFPVIRPMNWAGDIPGKGWCILEKAGRQLLLMNLLGKFAMKIEVGNFFDAADQALKEASKHGFDASILDMHAEATSEKRALAEYLDGRVNAVIGTHTHVQTNDAQTLSKGTGFLTDVGFCGPEQSVIGLNTSGAIEWLRSGVSRKIDPAEDPCTVCGCMVEISQGKTTVKILQERGVL